MFETKIPEESIALVAKTLRDGLLSEGNLVADFENRLGRLIKNYKTLAVNSGTSALHLALVLAGVKSGDEVIVPSQTFVATGLAVLFCGATPVLADVDPLTGEIDLDDTKRKITHKTKAIIAVDWAGYPCNYTALYKLGIPIIRDAAHSLLSSADDGRDNMVDFSCYSFQAIKTLTTGDGGAIACFRDSDYARGKKLRWFGISREHDRPDETGERNYNLREVGYKYHMNNVSAAIGLGQLDNLSQEVKNRQNLALAYQSELCCIPGLTLPNYSSDRKSSYWLFPILVENRKALREKLDLFGVESSVVHQGIDRNDIFGGKDESLIGQRQLDKTLLHIPIRGNLTYNEFQLIVLAIKQGW